MTLEGYSFNAIPWASGKTGGILVPGIRQLMILMNCVHLYSVAVSFRYVENEANRVTNMPTTGTKR